MILEDGKDENVDWLTIDFLVEKIRKIPTRRLFSVEMRFFWFALCRKVVIQEIRPKTALSASTIPFQANFYPKITDERWRNPRVSMNIASPTLLLGVVDNDIVQKRPNDTTPWLRSIGQLKNKNLSERSMNYWKNDETCWKHWRESIGKCK